jgi:hypothetical protein
VRIASNSAKTRTANLHFSSSKRYHYINLLNGSLLGHCVVQSRKGLLTFQRCLLPPSSGRWVIGRVEVKLHTYKLIHRSLRNTCYGTRKFITAITKAHTEPHSELVPSSSHITFYFFQVHFNSIPPPPTYVSSCEIFQPNFVRMCLSTSATFPALWPYLIS